MEHLKMAYFWGVILGLAIIFSPSLGCAVLEYQYGNVSDDQAIEVGSPLVFHCHLFPEVSEKYHVSAENLILKFKKRILTETRIIDRYTVEYSIENAGLEHNGMYNCFVPIKNFTSPQLVCSSIISVGSKPLGVSNFSCISLEYQNLTCSWTAPFNNVKTEYILYDYLLNDPNYGYRKCPAPDRRSSSCTFRMDTKPPYIPNQPVLNFILNGTNALGNSSQHFVVNHYEIVKPGVPNLLKVSNVSKTSVVLNIGPPKALENGEFKKGLVYSVKYYSVSTKLNITKEELAKSFGGVHILLSDLVPHTLYKFEVRVRLNITGDNFFWGDPRNVIELTKSDVPYNAPVIINSAFDIQEIAGYRSVTLYWKAVAAEYENGDGFHYIIKYHEHFIPSRYRRATSNDIAIRSNSTTFTVNDLDVDTAYLFNVFSANTVGNSTNLTAVLVVDKKQNLLPGPKEISVISYSQGHYDISWLSPDDTVQDFTLFWCKTLKFRPAKCEGPIDWMMISGQAHHELLLPNNSNYQFAVSAQQNDRTSGMLWAPCTVLYGVKYSIPRIELIPKNSTSLKVRWSLRCEAQKRVIQEYSIHYSPYYEHCSQTNLAIFSVNESNVLSWPSVSFNSTSKTEHTLVSLKPFTCYFAYLRVKTDSGWGERSDFAFTTTLSSAPSDPPSAVTVECYFVQNSTKTTTASIRVSFNPPTMPNGVITRYIIFYNRTLVGDSTYNSAKRREVWVQEMKEDTYEVLENLSYYSNYSVEVEACVDRACSQPSKSVYFYTGIAAPSTMALPRIELMDSFVNITWDAPALPNGPLDLYQIRMRTNDTEQLLNVSHQQQFLLERECDTDHVDETVYSFEVRALNVNEEGETLYGEFSKPVKTILCPSGFFPHFGIGVFVGASLVVIGCVFAVYVCYKWTKSNIIEAKRTEIHLPKELESSLDNPLSSYDKFKSGLQNNHDSGIPNDRTYERFFSVNGDLKISEERSNRNGPTGGRNLSGDSSASGKGHDSISSANTTKTHNSMDSGAEIESPPSPDSFSAMRPHAVPVSRDSGLDKEGSNLNVQLDGWCVKRTNTTEPGHGMFLANSEPSVADFDLGDGTEPLVNPVMQPYCKFGLARSASNGIDIHNNSPLKPGYSKFGIVYRPRQKMPKIMPPTYQSVFMATTAFVPISTPTTVSFDDHAYSKFGLSDPQNFAVAPCNGYCSLKTAVDNNLLIWEERNIPKPPSDNDADPNDDVDDNSSYSGCETSTDTPDECLEMISAPLSNWNISNSQQNGGRLISALFDPPKSLSIGDSSDNPSHIPVINCQGVIGNKDDEPVVTRNDSKEPSIHTVIPKYPTQKVSDSNLDDSSASSLGSDIVYVENLTFVEVDPVKVPLSSIEIPEDLQLDFSNFNDSVTDSSNQDAPQLVTGGTGSGFVLSKVQSPHVSYQILDEGIDSELAREIREALKDVRLEKDENGKDAICMTGFRPIVQPLSQKTATS